MPFSWFVASLFALDAARTLKKPNILLFFPDLSTAELNIGAADPAKFIAGTVYYSSTNLDNRK